MSVLLAALKAKGRVVIAEIDLQTLTRLATSEAEYRPIGKYPAIIRDLAVVLPDRVKTEEVLNVIEPLGGKMLIDTDLFDYYQDDELREEEEKSLAFHLTFQSPERTLTDKEADELVERIIKGLEEKGWEVKR